ncbi:cytoskeleton protein RodZ [Enterovibrio baiacu]|uniref:cytoskeleton protein RodZ n=1 Tax=Enterovibrio baiacu TaxID=2491023 RepID=UPI0010135FF0|nr:cytoskeleton protein RodZ [Enterovibrio baiacu]MBE1277093.1 cytoskeleton protein RodZ [Enterovibrio baiacu]
MNTEKNEEQLLDIEATHPGTALKQAREAQGLTEQDVADRLRLRVSVIRELEADCCDQKQIATFTRGYIRSYAKLVGLDADKLLCDFQPKKEHEDSAQQMQSFSRKTRLEKHDSRVMGLTWVILAAVIGLTAFWWWQNQQNDPLLSLPESANIFAQQENETSDDASASLEVVTDVIEPASTDAQRDIAASVVDGDAATSEDTTPDTNETAESVSTDIVLSKSEPTQVASSAERTETAAPATTAPVTTATVTAPSTAQTETPSSPLAPLTMRFSADCWVDVRDANGKRLVAGIKTAGESLSLSGKAPFKIVLGAPSAVDLAYDGKKVDLSGYPSGRVARLSLPK